MKHLIQVLLKFILPLAFGVGIFWLVYRNSDMEAIAEVVRHGISWGWVAISLLFALLSHIVRGLRWRLQLRSFGANPSTHDMSVAIFGNYGLNLVFPRLGEVWRCNYIAHNYNVSFSTTLGSMISERVVDMICAMLFLVMAFLLQSRVFFDFFETHTDAGSNIIAMIESPWLWIGLAVVAVITFLFRRKLSGTRFYQLFLGFAQRMWVGIKSVRDMKDGGWYVFYSILLWVLYFINSYTAVFFFDFTSHLDILAGLAIFVMGSLSLLVPVQGGLGAWHAMVIFTLGCYGVGQAEAQSFALVSWSIEQGFVLLLGLYAMIVVMFKKKQQKEVNS